MDLRQSGNYRDGTGGTLSDLSLSLQVHNQSRHGPDHLTEDQMPKPITYTFPGDSKVAALANKTVTGGRNDQRLATIRRRPDPIYDAPTGTAIGLVQETKITLPTRIGRIHRSSVPSCRRTAAVAAESRPQLERGRLAGTAPAFRSDIMGASVMPS